jgi:hypothetical protein
MRKINLKLLVLPVFFLALNSGAVESVEDKKEIKGHEGAVTNASVYFVEPKDGAVVKSKFKVKFGVKGMRVKPAGEIEMGTGHHHLIINSTPIGKDQVIPADEKHIHYGNGQTEAKLDLKPGEYTLTLQFADGKHMAYGPMMTSSIKITVK